MEFYYLKMKTIYEQYGEYFIRKFSKDKKLKFDVVINNYDIELGIFYAPESIEKHEKYEDVYRLSVELDDLIDEFYKKSEETKRNNLKEYVKKK